MRILPGFLLANREAYRAIQTITSLGRLAKNASRDLPTSMRGLLLMVVKIG
jgi:hypothetical protein